MKKVVQKLDFSSPCQQIHTNKKQNFIFLQTAWTLLRHIYKSINAPIPALTWHDITDGHETGVLEAGEITQLFPVEHAVPVSDGIVLRARRTAPYYWRWTRTSHTHIHTLHLLLKALISRRWLYPTQTHIVQRDLSLQSALFLNFLFWLHLVHK